MDSQMSSVGVNSVQISSNGEIFLGIIGMPQVIHVDIGEDIISKVIAFSKQGPMKIGIVCATGDVCNVTLKHSAMGGYTVMYEGLFTILSLRGWFMPSENSTTGGLNMLLARTDHSVLGGYVAGMLIAATPIQVVIVSSFIPKKEKLESKGCDDDVPNGTQLVDPPATE